MTDITLPAAAGAGLLSFLSPCVLPLAPPYLCYLAGASVEALVDESEAKARRDILITALLFVAGFSTVFVHGEPPFYAQVKRGRGVLNLRHMDRPVIDPALRDRESLLSADLGVDSAEEIKQLFLEFQGKGVTFFQTLKKEPWGARTFIVKDPDGNLLLFAGPGD